MSNSNVTISTLVATVATDLGLTKTATTSVVNAFLGALTEAVVAGETVRISGVGTFTTKEVAARTARNPSTGESVEVAASKKVSFKVAKPLKDAVKATVQG